MTDNQENQVDSVTGFLEGEFTPKHKTAFLKAFKKHGNQTKAANDLGIRFRLVKQALETDKEFKESFEETLLEMRHALEGALYQAGLGGRSKEAIQWLQAHFREDYGAYKKAKPNKSSKDEDLERLYAGLD